MPVPWPRRCGPTQHALAHDATLRLECIPTTWERARTVALRLKNRKAHDYPERAAGCKAHSSSSGGPRRASSARVVPSDGIPLPARTPLPARCRDELPAAAPPDTAPAASSFMLGLKQHAPMVDAHCSHSTLSSRPHCWLTSTCRLQRRRAAGRRCSTTDCQQRQVSPSTAPATRRDPARPLRPGAAGNQVLLGWPNRLLGTAVAEVTGQADGLP